LQSISISTKKQSLERQIKNILSYNSETKIISEVFTGTKVENRKEYQKLRKLLKKDDILIFDSVRWLCADY
jgi:predicted site-specific integrase-resolvase